MHIFHYDRIRKVHGTRDRCVQTTPWLAECIHPVQSLCWRRLHSPLMLAGVRNGTCSISCRSGGNHILSGCPGSTAVVVRNPTALPAADSSSRQLYEWQSSASGTDSIQQPQSAAAAGQRWPSTHTSRPAPSSDNNSVCWNTWTVLMFRPPVADGCGGWGGDRSGRRTMRFSDDFTFLKGSSDVYHRTILIDLCLSVFFHTYDSRLI